VSALDEALALLTPERILHDPAADGHGVRVAVIDSGVDLAVLATRHPGHEPITAAVARSGGVEQLVRPPSSPHGTTVADVILTVAPRVTMLSIDAFGPAGADVDVIVRAIRYAVAEGRSQIVNLSLGIAERTLQQPAKRTALYRAIEEAYFAGVTVIAAASNDHPFALSYPAAFGPALIGVDKTLFADPLTVAYDPREKIEFKAHGRGYLGPFAREPATSWATPHLTGVAARILSLRPDLKPFEVKAILFRLSGR
jgi:subtilisin family serine protease